MLCRGRRGLAYGAWRVRYGDLCKRLCTSDDVACLKHAIS